MLYPTLEDTYWKLARLHDQDVGADWQDEPYLFLHAYRRCVSGCSGYSQLVGNYVADEDRLSFGRLTTTRRTSLLGLEQEASFLAALPAVTRWRIQAEQLYLLDCRGECVLQFEARPTK